MTDNNDIHGDEEFVERSWLYNHIGRLSGGVLGLIAFIGIAFLAAIGSKPALGLLVVVLFGVFVIAVGSRLRSS